MNIIPNFTKILEKTTSFFPRLICFYRLYYRNIVKKEIELGNLTEKDTVLCIGGGPFPCTALEIAYQTGAKVCVVDCDAEAVSCAKRVIKKLNMSQNIKVVKSKGEDIDSSKFSVVHMALQVFPKDEILKSILKKCSDETRILVRSPKYKLRSLYFKDMQSCENNYCNQFTCQKNCTMNATLLFTKSKGVNNFEEVSSIASEHNISDSNIVVG